MQARLPERSGSTSPLACLPAHYITALPHASHPPPNPLLQTTVSPLSHLSTTSLHYNTKKVCRLRRLTDYTRPNRLPTDPVRRLRRRTATDHTTTLPCRGVVLRASPMPPGLSRAVLHPRCARARPAPSPAWLVMSSVLDDPTLPESSPLRGSPIPVLYGASGLCHAVPMQDRDVTPSPPAHPTRNGGLQCQRWLHAPNAPGWHCGCGAASFQPPSPAAVPGGPDKDHASKAVMVFASCPALSRLPCGTRTASIPIACASGTQACAPGHPDKSGFHGVEHPASSLRTARVAVRRGFRLRKPERSEARGGDASQQPGNLDLFLSSTGSPTGSFQQQQIRPSGPYTRRHACQVVALGEDWSRRSTSCEGGRRVNSHPQDRLRRSTRGTKATLQYPDVCFARILVAPPVTHIAALARYNRPMK